MDIRNVAEKAHRAESNFSYAEAGRLYFVAAVQYSKNGKDQEAADCFMSAARALEKGETWREISALWNAAGDSLVGRKQKSFGNERGQDYIYMLMSDDLWEKATDLEKQVMVYENAGNASLQFGATGFARYLYRKAAQKIERS